MNEKLKLTVFCNQQLDFTQSQDRNWEYHLPIRQLWHCDQSGHFYYSLSSSMTIAANICIVSPQPLVCLRAPNSPVFLCSILLFFSGTVNETLTLIHAGQIPCHWTTTSICKFKLFNLLKCFFLTSEYWKRIKSYKSLFKMLQRMVCENFSPVYV